MAGETTLGDGVVVLRPWQPDDAPAVHRACQAADIRRWTTVPSPYGEADAREFVETLSPSAWAKGSEFSFAVLADGDLVASVGLARRSTRVYGDTGEIGYWAAPWARGKGYMGRAVRLVCGWGFEVQRLDRIGWHAEVGNGPSRRVAERCGFRVEGVRRGMIARAAGRADAWTGSLLPSDPMHALEVEPLLPPTLASERLLLRPVSADDVEPIVAGCADPEVMRWIGVPSPYTRAHAADFVAGQVGAPWDGRFDLAITALGDGRFVGVIGLFGRQRATARVEIGYWIAAPVRGRGYATEAVTALTDWALIEAGLHRVALRAAVDNVASRRVAERAGYSFEGYERDAGLDRAGGWRTMASYARLARDPAVR